MADEWKDLANSIIETVRTRAKKVWDDNAAARTLIEDAAKDFAKLALRYKLETDPNAQDVLKQEMLLAKQTIENETSALALIATAEAKATFLAVVSTAFDILLKALPVILAAA